MHEMSITSEIIEICLQHAEGRRLKTVVIEIGNLSSVVPEALEFCFEACTNSTSAQGASLEIRKTPGSGICKACGDEQSMENLYDPCRICGSYAVEIISGQEMRVIEIEVDY